MTRTKTTDMNAQGSAGRILVATVGAGHRDNLQDSLFVPMMKSIEEGEWEKIVLLPSRETEENARQLADQAGKNFIIRPLPEPDQENDADACFGHFDQVIGEMIDTGVEPDHITADFTRGTKPMSAALALAAVGRGVPVLRYVHGEQRDDRGTVIAGTEKVGRFLTVRAMDRRRLDLATDLLRHADFGAATSVLPDDSCLTLWPQEFRNECAGIEAVARVAAAWDRLNYTEAQQLIERHADTLRNRPAPFRFSQNVLDWVKRLANRPEQQEHARMVCWLRAIVCDLLANAERRSQSFQFEDALLRSYRVLELVGQIRLFDRGYDSSCLPSDDPEVKAFQSRNNKGNNSDFGVNKDGTLTAPRELTARFLKHLGDPLAKRLLQLGNKAVSAQDRNKSILVHGYTATAPAEAEPLTKILQDLGSLLQEEDPVTDVNKRLSLARALSFDSA